MSNTIAVARENGYVETIMKRRRYLPDINQQMLLLEDMLKEMQLMRQYKDRPQIL